MFLSSQVLLVTPCHLDRFPEISCFPQLCLFRVFCCFFPSGIPCSLSKVLPASVLLCWHLSPRRILCLHAYHTFCGILGPKNWVCLYLSLSNLVETKIPIFTSPSWRYLNRGSCCTLIFDLRSHLSCCIFAKQQDHRFGCLLSYVLFSHHAGDHQTFFTCVILFIFY